MPSAVSRCVRVDAATFAAEHWSQAPLLSRAKQLPADFADLLSIHDVDELVAERALRTPFFRTVREGEGLPVPVRTVTAGNRRIADLVDGDALRAQHADGATLVLQSLHRIHPPVARFCRALAAELGHATQCNAYVTPGGHSRGFDFHHDTHDVFVLQVSGRKRWIVHEPVVTLPLPSQPQAGAHLVAKGAAPLLDVELEAGDALYLPRGYVHAALTTDEPSLHLTVGVLTTTWFDVLGDAVSLAAQDLVFRAALPAPPLPAIEQVAAFLQQAAGWLAALPPEQVQTLLAARLAKAVPPEPVGLLAAAAVLAGLGPETALRPRTGLSVTLVPAGTVPETQDGPAARVSLRLPASVLSLPESCRPALERALAGPATAADLAVGSLSVDDAVVLARRLLREGVLVGVAGSAGGS